MRLAAALFALAGAAAAQTPNYSTCAVRTPTLQGGYVGECIGGLASGRGRASGMDRYEGAFRDGQPNGFGVYTYPDGRRYEGEFVDGKVNGRARFYFQNGDMLEGAFRENRLVGTGRMVRATGETLGVEWRDNTLVPVALAPTPAVPPLSPMSPPSPGSPAQPFPGGNAQTAATWVPRLDFEDLFPSYILAAATRKPLEGARSLNVPRGDPLGDIGATARLQGDTSDPAPTAQSRYAGGRPDAMYLGDPWGLVGIKFRNSVAGTRVTMRVTVDEIAEPTDAEFTLPEVGDYALYPRLRYRFDRLRNVAQPMPVNISWTVSVDGQPATTQTGVARVRSVQDAPLFVQTERGAENMSWVFAGFVTEDAPWLDALLKEAFQGAAIGAIGYQRDEAAVHQQVAVVYEYLRKRGFRYSSITATSGASSRVASQIVRFPSDSVRTSQANCIDGTVLMASILRKIGVEPIIVMGPGHAMLGYYPQADPKQGFVVVETTMLESAGFVDAVRAGMATYKGWQEKSSNHPMFKRVPVAEARRAGVMPIAR